MTHVPPRAVIFDLDDTLFAEWSYFESGLGAVADFLAGPDSGRRTAWRERLRADVAQNGRIGVFQRIPPPSGRSEGWIATLLHVYRAHRPTIATFPDVAPFLQRARREGIRLGLVTDGKSLVQRRKAEALDLPNRLDAIVCTDDIDLPKPAVEPFLAVSALLGVSPEVSVYVADDPSKDFIGPRQLGMATIHLRRPLPRAIAKSAPGSGAEAERSVTTLAEAAELIFGGSS
jgi:putative hydrolase of the HAD superfamily